MLLSEGESLWHCYSIHFKHKFSSHSLSHSIAVEYEA